MTAPQMSLLARQMGDVSKDGPRGYATTVAAF